MITSFIHSFWLYLNSAEFFNTVVHNRFYLIFLVIALSFIKRHTFNGILMTSLVNIPGTILHEIAHFMVGLVLNAKPASFNLLPKRRDNVYVMGSVGFRNIKFYNAFPSAMAPLLLLPLAYWLNEYFLVTTIWRYIFFILLETVIIENAIPSATDFKVAFSSPLGLLFYGSIACALILFL